MRGRVGFILGVLGGCAAKSSPSSAPEGLAGPPGPPATIAAPAQRAVDGVTSWRRSLLPANTSRLMVGDTQQLALEQMEMKVQVEGFRARVLVDFVFNNDNADRQALEGTFQMRLPDEASPYFLAFGPGTLLAEPRPPTSLGELLAPAQIMATRGGEWADAREARVAPRELASVAYTQTVQPRLVRVVVDPALSEWAGAGVFNSRVFPISAGRRHRVAFGYDVDLAPAGPDLALELPVPREVGSVRVDVEVAKTARVSPAAAAVTLGDRRVYRFEDPGEPITVRISDRPMLLHGTDAATGPHFAARVVPTLPDAPAVATAERAIFAVDTSLSANPTRYALWLTLLREVLQQNRGSLREFAVVFFNVETKWWQPRFAANTPESVEALLGFADTLGLEGATDVGAAMAQAAAPPWGARGAWDVFLMSDGAATWGERDARVVGRAFDQERASCADGGCPAGLYLYRTHGTGVDPRLLRLLARETGGAVIAVEDERAASRVALAHRRRPWDLAGVTIDGGTDVLVAGRPQSLVAGQPLVVVGRGAPARKAKLRLRLRQGSDEREVVVDPGAAIGSTLAPRIFGQVAVDQLEETIEGNRGAAEIFARHFRVPGEACSLLMLEDEADYRRFGLEDMPAEAPTVLRGSVGDAVARVSGVPVDVAAAPRVALMREMDALLRRGVAIDGRVLPLLMETPGEALVLPAAPLATRTSAWRDIPAVLRPQLERQDIDEGLLWAHAGERRAKFGAADGLKALSSLAEVRPGDEPLLRGLAVTAIGWGLSEAAAQLLRRASGLPPYDPLVHHLLAVALAESGRPELAVVHFESALASGWEPRFGNYREVVALDYARLLDRASTGARAAMSRFATARLDEVRALAGPVTGPLVVAVHWTGDDTDVDLHVIEPDGADCHYGAPTTKHGELRIDATDGYGPEVYRLREAVPGTYKVAAKLFSGPRNRTSSRVQALVSVTREAGTSRETVTRHAVTLAPGKVPVEITTVVLP